MSGMLLAVFEDPKTQPIEIDNRVGGKDGQWD
jgi:hypothetical protein